MDQLAQGLVFVDGFVGNVGAEWAKLAKQIDSRKKIHARQSRNPRGGGSGLLINGVVSGLVGVAAAAGFLLWRRRRAVAQVRGTGVPALVAAAADYEYVYRDCLDGEQHDKIVVEDKGEGDGSPPDADGESVVSSSDTAPKKPKAVRGPASRRVAVRKKLVHTAYHGNFVSQSFKGDVIAQARLLYNARIPDSHTRCLARSFMVRKMTEAGMRTFDIESNIDNMVVAVFFVTDAQRSAMRNEKILTQAGLFGLGGKD